MARRRHELLPFEPQHRRPVVPVRAVDFPQRRRHHSDVRELLHGPVDHGEERVRVQLRFVELRHLRPGDAEALLQVLLVADEAVDVLHDLAEGLLRGPPARGGVPQFRPVIQVETRDRPRGLGGLHPLDDDLGRGVGQRREDAARVEPLHPAGEDGGPVEVAGLEPRRGLVRPVVEDHRRADALAAVAVDGGEVRPADAVVVVVLEERRDAHLADAALDEVADGVVDHRGADAGAEAEAVAEVGADVVFAAGDVDFEVPGLAEREDAGVEAVDEGPEAEEVEGGGSGPDGQHGSVSGSGWGFGIVGGGYCGGTNMAKVRGVYRNGVIELLEPVPVDWYDGMSFIITFRDEDEVVDSANTMTDPIEDESGSYCSATPIVVTYRRSK